MKQITHLSLVLCALLGLTHTIFPGPDPKDYQKKLQSKSPALEQPLALQNIAVEDWWYAAPALAHAVPAEKIQQPQQLEDQDALGNSPNSLDAQLLKAAKLGLVGEGNPFLEKPISIEDATNLVQDLLTQGASALCQDEDGNTALHYAIQLRFEQAHDPVCRRMIELLMLMDADPHQPNRTKRSVMDIIHSNIKYGIVYSNKYQIMLNIIEPILAKRKEAVELMLREHLPLAIANIIAAYTY